jgi:hypothetical protein
MLTARYWPASRLLLTWLALFVAFAAVRWLLVAGIYQASIQDQQVIRHAGVWSEGFATLMTGVGIGVVALALFWATATWFAGRSERRARQIAAGAGHRRVLM